jgi:hypothetical protein
MKLTNLFITLLLSLLVFSAKAQQVCPPTPSTLAPVFNLTNQWTGSMFDVRAINDVTVLCFEINMFNVTRDIEVYTRQGTHVGFEDDPTGWTFVGVAPGVVSLGLNNRTPVPLTINVDIDAGETVAFYVTATAGTAGDALAYTLGTNVGDVYAANADLEVLTGTASSYPFTTPNFRPRNANIVINYGPQSAVIPPAPIIPAYTPTLSGTAAYSKGNLEWARPIDTTGTLPPIEQFEVYITDDGGVTYTLAAITREYSASLDLLNGIEYGFRVRPMYVIQGSNSYLAGNYSNVVYLRPSIVLGTENTTDAAISVFPNPSEGNFTLNFANITSQKAAIKVMDLTGKTILVENLNAISGNSSHSVSLPKVATGMYIIQVETEKGIYQHKISITK